MSPELLDCTMPLSPVGLLNCDLYSLGAVLWELGSMYCHVTEGASPVYQHVFQSQLPELFTQSDVVELVIVKQLTPGIPPSYAP